MPRKPRVFGDDLCYHVILRCNNRERLLFGSEFSHFLSLLENYKFQFSLRLYDYVLMQSHVHLMLSTHHGHRLDVAMREFCLAFSKQYNRRHERIGHFWRDRYWCRVVGDDRYALACLRYFAWNAVKAGLVTNPREWPWCGCRFHLGVEPNRLLECHPAYLGLGSTPESRSRNYGQLIEYPIQKREEQLFRLRSQLTSKCFEKILNQLGSHLNPQ